MEVVFSVDCSCTAPGENVFIVGCCKELGNWNPSEAVPCFTSSAAFPRWTSNAVKLPIGSRMEFKVVIRGHHGWRWEHGENRLLEVELPMDPEAKKLVTMAFGQQGIKDVDAVESEEAATHVAQKRLPKALGEERTELPTLPMLLGQPVQPEIKVGAGLQAMASCDLVKPPKAASPSAGDVEGAPALQQSRFHLRPNMQQVISEHGPNGEEPVMKAAESCTPEQHETYIQLHGTLAAIRKAKRRLQLFVSKTFICTFKMPTPEATAAAGRMLGKVPWVWDVKLHGHNLLRLNAHEASLEQVFASMTSFSSYAELRRRDSPGSHRSIRCFSAWRAAK
ncbi:cgt [Symbiodinium natans]|uniref:Cgt protein n=1 Tax=Symbiodinium natans TaxID=878477 RepID=A0A812KC98_9DINO|nr:cgt [Symbiodinium natans]